MLQYLLTATCSWLMIVIRSQYNAGKSRRMICRLATNVSMSNFQRSYRRMIYRLKLDSCKPTVTASLRSWIPTSEHDVLSYF